MTAHMNPAGRPGLSASSQLTSPAPQSVGAFQESDPHLIDKINRATTCRELNAVRDAFKARGAEMPGDAVQALARQRAELQRKGK